MNAFKFWIPILVMMACCFWFGVKADWLFTPAYSAPPPRDPAPAYSAPPPRDPACVLTGESGKTIYLWRCDWVDAVCFVSGKGLQCFPKSN